MFNKEFVSQVESWANGFGLGMKVDGETMIVSGKAGETTVENGKGVIKTTNEAMKKKLDDLYIRYNKLVVCDFPSAYDRNIEPPAEVVDKAEGKHEVELVDEIKRIFGIGDMMEIFGKSGSCKSKMMEEVARSAIRLGLKVNYLDSERNLSKKFIDELGPSYKYNPKFDDLKQMVFKLPPADVLLFDSAGLPALTKVARMGRTAGMNEKGAVYLDLIAMFGAIKDWCFDNQAIAIVSNQPESEFLKTEDQMKRLEPFGDKSAYVVKNILRTVKRKPQVAGVTYSDLISHRTRDFADEDVLGNITVSNMGTKVKFMV